VSHSRFVLFSFLVMSCALCHAAAAPKPVLIQTPLGGEFFVTGTSQKVRLDPKTRNKMVAIELSTDGGTTFSPLGTIDNTDRDKTKHNVLGFVVPNTPSGNCVIRATDGTAVTLSSAFSIGTASAAAADGTFVKKAGDTVTGKLNFSLGNAIEFFGNPAASYQTGADGNGFVIREFDGSQATPKIAITNTGDVKLGFSGGVLVQDNSNTAIVGGLSLKTGNVTGNITANTNTCVFFCNTAANNITVTLPAASTTRSGTIFVIKKTNASNTVTISPASGTMIDGVASLSLTTINTFRVVICDGNASYFVIGQ